LITSRQFSLRERRQSELFLEIDASGTCCLCREMVLLKGWLGGDEREGPSNKLRFFLAKTVIYKGGELSSVVGTDSLPIL
jgi:hypothetical protein